ncbi:TetR/AcrR family transcriptional regulator [Candidatus Viridilinea mediisalina]|uniref:HTH tetR-type domain-containing protein n=1 Tax=Candidatus Viridilinea mediisalina TaxID=2024553 RepID=A0A2A6RLP1_9CHLR|nr:TetR/AcrR family transcriptional regulator [Candidatus Viridilinea mediisalina]PDW03778.1 hypothetical protein CJ255_06895 [Candidatus Viridilinea mediisalina]
MKSHPPENETDPPISASAARRTQARIELRAKILAAAAELFIARGYEGLSMRQLGERIGYSPATIYLHFANKDALLLALLSDGYNELGRRLAAVAAATHDPLERIAAVGRAYVAFGREQPMHYQLMFMRRADVLRERLAERSERVDAFQVLQLTVTQAQAAGVLQPGDTLAISLTLWATVHGMVGLFLVGPPLPEAQIQVTIETTIAGILYGLAKEGLR